MPTNESAITGVRTGSKTKRVKADCRSGNLKEYIDSNLITAVGGSWLAPRNLINEKNWDQIEKNAREAVALIDS